MSDKRREKKFFLFHQPEAIQCVFVRRQRNPLYELFSSELEVAWLDFFRAEEEEWSTMPVNGRSYQK